jgi:invasion protein IalB
VRAIRNARAEYGVELGKKIAASIVASAPETQARLQVCSSPAPATNSQYPGSWVKECSTKNFDSECGC